LRGRSRILEEGPPVFLNDVAGGLGRLDVPIAIPLGGPVVALGEAVDRDVTPRG
jgi:hypothetical protein